MAKPTTKKFGDFRIFIGDGNSPEAFAEPCGFTSKALDIDASASTTVTPDCDSPDDPSWEEAAVTALSGTVNGTGVMASESYATWRNWMLSGAEKNVRIQPMGSAAGYYYGSAIMLKLGHSVAIGTDGNRVQATVNIRNAGEWLWNEGP